jgi:hypothetical protein
LIQAREDELSVMDWEASMASLASLKGNAAAAVVDGTLLQGCDGALYVVEDGRRRAVPDPYTVRASGLDPRRVEIIGDRDLQSLPLGVPLARAKRAQIHLDSYLGLGHYVSTHGLVNPRGYIDAQTRTRSVSWFCGYHSGVYLLFGDAVGLTIGSSTMQVFGVDGAWMGRSDRTDYWGEEIDPDVTARARTLAVAHTGAPQVLQRTVERAIAGSWAIADVVTEVNRTIGDATSTGIV